MPWSAGYSKKYAEAVVEGAVVHPRGECRVRRLERVGGIPEMIKDGKTGLLVDPDNPGALAEALMRVLKDRDCGRSLQEMDTEPCKSIFAVKPRAPLTKGFFMTCYDSLGKRMVTWMEERLEGPTSGLHDA
jgi:hypothetical protein